MGIPPHPPHHPHHPHQVPFMPPPYPQAPPMPIPQYYGAQPPHSIPIPIQSHSGMYIPGPSSYPPTMSPLPIHPNAPPNQQLDQLSSQLRNLLNIHSIHS
jgi:hypothetical protein